MSCKRTIIKDLRTIILIKYNKRNGTFENKAYTTKCYYINGKKNGKASEYFIKYKINEIMYFINNKLNGESISYDKNNNITKRSYYMDHKLNGKFIYYNNFGSTHMEDYFIDNIKLKTTNCVNMLESYYTISYI